MYRTKLSIAINVLLATSSSPVQNRGQLLNFRRHCSLLGLAVGFNEGSYRVAYSYVTRNMLPRLRERVEMSARIYFRAVCTEKVLLQTV